MNRTTLGRFDILADADLHIAVLNAPVEHAAARVLQLPPMWP